MNSNSFFSRNLPIQLRDLLLVYGKARVIRCEADFYGASDLISYRLGLARTPYSYSSWFHGWAATELRYKEQLVWDATWKFKRLVRNEVAADFLRGCGVRNVVAASLPILYTSSFEVRRDSESVLFMPAHSLSYVEVNQNIDQMVQEALMLKNKGCYVCFCVHPDCVKANKVVPDLDKHGIDWFVGACVEDANSLQRMRNVFDYFETVVSNTIGSHFVYSQLFGAKFRFIEPYYEYNPNQFLNDPFLGPRPELREHLMQQSSYAVIYEKYRRYFTSHENAICDIEYARQECGYYSMKSPQELAKHLGWTFPSNAVSYMLNKAFGLKNKVARNFEKVRLVIMGK